jgi:uncharacterized protein (TIGR02186 family)
MTKRYQLEFMFVALSAFILFNARIMAQAQTPAVISVRPEKVGIGTFYNGENVTVTAAFPAGYEVAMKLTGPDEDLELMQKGRVWGLWMNVEEVFFQKVPSLYIVMTSKRLDELARPGILERFQIRYRTLRSRAQLRGSRDSRPELFDQLIRLKEHDQLYSISENGLKIKHFQGHYNKVVAEFYLPPKAPPGQYKIELIGFKDKEAIILGSSTLKLEKKGLSAFLYNIANRHGLLYGFLAVLIALISGLSIGILFSPTRRH